MDKNEIAVQELKKGINIAVEESVRNAPFNKIEIGRIISSSDNGYNVEINKKIYEDIPTLGATCTTNEMVKMICNRISQKCEMSENELVKLSVAVGCATKESEQDDIHQVLKTAEKNMYNDKIKTGRIFYNEVLDKISSKLCIDRIESIEHVAELSEIIMYIGQQLKLTDEEIQKLLLLARYHDVGKIMIDKRIILKPGPLSKSEFEVVVGHSELGYNMVKSFPELLQIADNVLYNHEWWDGTGYPIGLAGDKIPKITRLFAILEAYIVMTQENVYKDAISKEEAITELKRCSGTQFDPYFVELICELIIPGR